MCGRPITCTSTSKACMTRSMLTCQSLTGMQQSLHTCQYMANPSCWALSPISRSACSPRLTMQCLHQHCHSMCLPSLLACYTLHSVVACTTRQVCMYCHGVLCDRYINMTSASVRMWQLPPQQADQLSSMHEVQRRHQDVKTVVAGRLQPQPYTLTLLRLVCMQWQCTGQAQQAAAVAHGSQREDGAHEH